MNQLIVNSATYVQNSSIALRIGVKKKNSIYFYGLVLVIFMMNMIAYLLVDRKYYLNILNQQICLKIGSRYMKNIQKIDIWAK